MFGSAKKKQTSSPTLPGNIEEEPVPSVDFNQIDRLLNSEIKDDDIQLTDADLEDPELLAQLSQIEGGGNVQKPPQKQQQPVTKTVSATTTTTVKKVAPPQPKVRTEEDELNDLMDFDNDNKDTQQEEDIIDHQLIQKLEERLVLYKVWAVYSSQQNDKAESLKYMRARKLIIEALDNLKEGLPIEMSTLPPHLPTLPPNHQQSQPQRVATPQSQQSPQSQPQKPQQSLAPQKITTPVKLTPSVQSPKTEILSKETIEAEERTQTWDLIEEDFRRKHYNLTSEAVRLRDVDKIAAIHLLKESKGVHAIIDQIEINRKLGLDPPPFHFEEKVTSTKITFNDIKDNELVIKISNGTDLSKALSSDFTISGEIPYPSPETPTRFQTNSISLNDSNFNYTTKIQIERKKTLQRCLEKKKMTLVFYSTKMFFMKSVVGKCEVRLSDLLTKCEFNEKVPILKDGSKKETGSFINVNIRMRTPFLQDEMKVVKEKVLVLDSPITIQPQQSQPQQPQSHQQQPQQPQQTTTTTTISTKTSETTTTNTSPEKSTTINTSPTVTTTTTTISPAPETAEKPAASKPAASTNTDNEKTDDEEVEDLDKVVSNNVLEMILETTKQQIATQGPKQDLLDRKQAVELKIMILETNVSAGILTMEDYIDQLQKAIAADIKLAIELKKKGRQDLAVKLMQRVSIMKKEMEGGDEE